MDIKGSFFSRVKRGKSTARKLRGFLNLPAEVRNQIYDCYFRNGFRCEIAARKSIIDQLAEKAPSDTIKLCVGITRGENPVSCDEVTPHATQQRKIRVSRRWGNYKRVQGNMTKWGTSLCSLILVCTQIYRESVVFLYQNTTFAFDSTKRINNLFRWVPTKNLAFVTKLQLHYVPHHGKGWKEKHQLAWSSACKAFTKKMTGLQDLSIFIYTAQGVRWFDLREEFVQPILQFRRLSVPKKSKRPSTCSRTLKVKVHFTSYWSRKGFDHEPLTNASNHLHRLYGQAIEKAVLGATEEEAMAGFFDAWEGKYAMWKHHLQYNETGW